MRPINNMPAPKRASNLSTPLFGFFPLLLLTFSILLLMLGSANSQQQQQPSVDLPNETDQKDIDQKDVVDQKDVIDQKDVVDQSAADQKDVVDPSAADQTATADAASSFDAPALTVEKEEAIPSLAHVEDEPVGTSTIAVEVGTDQNVPEEASSSAFRAANAQQQIVPLLLATFLLIMAAVIF